MKKTKSLENICAGILIATGISIFALTSWYIGKKGLEYFSKACCKFEKGIYSHYNKYR